MLKSLILVMGLVPAAWGAPVAPNPGAPKSIDFSERLSKSFDTTQIGKKKSRIHDDSSEDQMKAFICKTKDESCDEDVKAAAPEPSAAPVPTPWGHNPMEYDPLAE